MEKNTLNSYTEEFVPKSPQRQVDEFNSFITVGGGESLLYHTYDATLPLPASLCEVVKQKGLQLQMSPISILALKLSKKLVITAVLKIYLYKIIPQTKI